MVRNVKLYYTYQEYTVIHGGSELCTVNAEADSTLKNKSIFLYTLSNKGNTTL